MSRAHLIDRVAVRGIGDPAAGRAWARRALEPADLDGIVPPAATLVLRSVALSGRRPDAALRQAAHDAARAAARPALGPVGAGAEAVLFADDAELLACLFRDLLDGSFTRAWWWAARCRPSRPPAAVVARTCVEQVRAVPAALELLARTGQAAAALAVLPERAVHEIAAAAVAAGVLAPAVAAQAFTVVPPAASAGLEPAPAPEPRPETTRAAGDVADAGGPVAVLGAVLLLAHRSPAALAALPDRAVADAVAAARAASARARLSDRSATNRDAPSPAAVHVAPSPPASVQAARPPITAAEQPPVAPALAATAAPTLAVARAAFAADPLTRAQPGAAPRAGSADSPGNTLRPLADAGARTRLAGAFLLLTVAVDLGLYPDFTRPRARGLPMSPWTWLGHTTAQLVGVRDPHDPLWAMLAELADEPDAPPPGRAPALRTTTRRVARRLDAALGRRRSAPRVVVRSGTVHAGPARVDVTFALADLDLAIRRCGLDSDPGWMPAAARDIRLHYT